jgi:hypothetical protein
MVKNRQSFARVGACPDRAGGECLTITNAALTLVVVARIIRTGGSAAFGLPL